MSRCLRRQCALRCLLIDLNDEQVLEEEAADKAAKEKNFPSFEAGDLLELTLVRPVPAHHCSRSETISCPLLRGALAEPCKHLASQANSSGCLK